MPAAPRLQKKDKGVRWRKRKRKTTLLTLRLPVTQAALKRKLSHWPCLAPARRSRHRLRRKQLLQARPCGCSCSGYQLQRFEQGQQLCWPTEACFSRNTKQRWQRSNLSRFPGLLRGPQANVDHLRECGFNQWQGVEHNRDKPVPTHEVHAGPWLPGAKIHDWRPRIWTSLPSKAPVCVLCAGFRSHFESALKGHCPSFWNTDRKLVSSCLRSAPCATKCLLNPDLDSHAEILRFALAEVVKIQEKAAERKAPPNNTWMNKHMEYAKQLGVRWATPLPVELVTNDWFSTLTKRFEIVASCRTNCRVPKLEPKCWESSWQRAAGQWETCCAHHAARTGPLDWVTRSTPEWSRGYDPARLPDHAFAWQIEGQWPGSVERKFHRIISDRFGWECNGAASGFSDFPSWDGSCWL